jgi:hypothetical protein
MRADMSVWRAPLTALKRLGSEAEDYWLLETARSLREFGLCEDADYLLGQYLRKNCGTPITRDNGSIH